MIGCPYQIDEAAEAHYRAGRDERTTHARRPDACPPLLPAPEQRQRFLGRDERALRRSADRTEAVRRDQEETEEERELGKDDGGGYFFTTLALVRHWGGILLMGDDLVRRTPAPTFLAVSELLEIIDSYDEDAGSGIAQPSDDQGRRRPPAEETTTSEDHHVITQTGVAAYMMDAVFPVSWQRRNNSAIILTHDCLSVEEKRQN